MIHSNYLRAKQTWQSICSELPKAGAVEESGDITPMAIRASWRATTALAAKHDSILMVSHLPLVGYLVQSLCPAAGAPCLPPQVWPVSSGKMARGSCSGWKDHTIR